MDLGSAAFAVGDSTSAAKAVPLPDCSTERALVGIVGTRRETDVGIQQRARVGQPMAQQADIRGSPAAPARGVTCPGDVSPGTPGTSLRASAVVV